MDAGHLSRAFIASSRHYDLDHPLSHVVGAEKLLSFLHPLACNPLNDDGKSATVIVGYHVGRGTIIGATRRRFRPCFENTSQKQLQAEVESPSDRGPRTGHGSQQSLPETPPAGRREQE